MQEGEWTGFAQMYSVSLLVFNRLWLY